MNLKLRNIKNEIKGSLGDYNFKHQYIRFREHYYKNKIEEMGKNPEL